MAPLCPVSFITLLTPLTFLSGHTHRSIVCVSLFELQKRQCKGVIPLTIELGGLKAPPRPVSPHTLPPGLQPLLWASLGRSKPLY